MRDTYGHRVLLDDGEPSWGLVAVYCRPKRNGGYCARNIADGFCDEDDAALYIPEPEAPSNYPPKDSK